VNYFKEREQVGDDYLYEAKLLIVGEPGSGKTTLFRKLEDVDAAMPEEEETTRGIDIHKFGFQLADKPGKEFTVNVWDFGGQEIYHATHQFFLTRRSLYVLLSDARKENTDFNYWLMAIELLSDKSPVVIVNNEKGGRKADIDLKGLHSRFGNILTPVHTLDLSKDADKTMELRRFIEFHIQRLEFIGVVLPATWVAIRKELEGIAKIRPFIKSDEYYSICEKHKITEREKMLRLSSYLHDLGTFLHFQKDPLLKRWVFLRNEWATDAVYAIMDDGLVKDENSGHFTMSDIERILDGDDYCDMCDEVVKLMMNFELCYPIPDTHPVEYLAPQLLPVEQREYEWDAEDNLQLRYAYEFMPKGLISRFIVRAHQYVENNEKLWRSGAIMQRGNTRAEVIETYGRRSISIRVSGRQKKELLTIAAEHFDMLNRSYEGMKWNKLVPCNCSLCHLSIEPHFYTHADLARRIERNKRTVECPVSYEDVDVQKLLDDVFVTRSDVKAPLRVFISYSRKDKEYLEDLKVFLTPLMRDQNMILWDDNTLKPGEEWDKSIRRELMRADIIIFLISPDLLATDYIWTVEMKEALERNDRAEAKMIPVLIRDCLWRSSPFARYNIIPEKGKPLSSFPNQDEGWKIIAEQIEESILQAYNMNKF